MLGDDVEHIRSAVRRSHVGDPERTVFASRRSQVVHPAAVGRIPQNAVAVEDVSEAQRETMSLVWIAGQEAWWTETGGTGRYRGVMQRLLSRHHISDETLYRSAASP